MHHDTKKLTIRTPSEILAMRPEWRHRRVRFNRRNLTLAIETNDCGHIYEIDLECWTHPAEILDMILQVAGKEWCDGEVLQQLLEAIEHVAEVIFNNNAQGVFCPGGHNMLIDWKAKTYCPV